MKFHYSCFLSFLCLAFFRKKNLSALRNPCVNVECLFKSERFFFAQPNAPFVDNFFNSSEVTVAPKHPLDTKNFLVPRRVTQLLAVRNAPELRIERTPKQDRIPGEGGYSNRKTSTL